MMKIRRISALVLLCALCVTLRLWYRSYRGADMQHGDMFGLILPGGRSFCVVDSLRGCIQFNYIGIADPSLAIEHLSMEDDCQPDAHIVDYWVLPASERLKPMNLVRRSQTNYEHLPQLAGTRISQVCIMQPLHVKEHWVTFTRPDHPGFWCGFGDDCFFSIEWLTANGIKTDLGGGTKLAIIVPYWALATIISALIILSFRKDWRLYRRSRQLARGFCLNCSYDLRAHLARSPSPTQDAGHTAQGLLLGLPESAVPLPPRCPECGTTISSLKDQCCSGGAAFRGRIVLPHRTG